MDMPWALVGQIAQAAASKRCAPSFRLPGSRLCYCLVAELRPYISQEGGKDESQSMLTIFYQCRYDGSSRSVCGGGIQGVPQRRPPTAARLFGGGDHRRRQNGVACRTDRDSG